MDFIFINQNVLNDLFYILVSIFVYYFLIDHVSLFQKYRHYRQLLMVVCLSVPLILCMRFPIYIAPNCVHDLRQLPFIIGTLNGGWTVGLPLLMILLIVRFVFYGYNYITVVIYITMLIVCAIYSRTYNQLNRSQKLVMAPMITFFLAILSTIIAVVISDFQVTDTYIIDFIIVPTIAILFLIYIIELLSEAMMMRTKLIKVEKMEIVSQLAASISHEVRNPLTVVQGFMQLLKSPSLSKEIKDQYIHIALEELNRAKLIIDDYLTFAKPAPEKIETIDVDRELQKVVDIVRPLANMNSITISSDVHSGCTIGSIQYFQQCFLNLVKNAVEAMPNGGELTISSYLVDERIVIKIKDTGIGMTPEQISRYGEPYFSTKEKGTGLGTMVALKIIQTMNGTLEIDSAVNKGTTLTITLPLKDE
jgi:two-component system, sporulation sensor kinase B